MFTASCSSAWCDATQQVRIIGAQSRLVRTRDAASPYIWTNRRSVCPTNLTPLLGLCLGQGSLYWPRKVLTREAWGLSDNLRKENTVLAIVSHYRQGGEKKLMLCFLTFLLATKDVCVEHSLLKKMRRAFIPLC